MAKKSRRKRKQAKAEQRARLEKNVLAMEGVSLLAGDVEVVDPRDYWPTEYALSGLGGAYARQDDRAKGEQPPTIETQQDLDLMWGIGRLLADVNCAGIGLLGALTNYTIGDGWVFGVDSHPRVKASEQLLDACNAVLEDNLEANEWHGDLDRELFRRSVRDGEFLLACYPAGDEYTHLRVVEPEQVRDQGDDYPIAEDVLASHGVYPQAATNWRLGVHKYDHDAQHVLGYLVEWNDGPDYLPASVVVHAKRNTDRSAARGISDFWPAWRWLQSQEKLLRRTGNGASLQAAIAWMVKHAQGVVQSQVTDMRRDNASYTMQRRTPNGTIQQVDVEQYDQAGGVVVDHGHSTEVTPGPGGQRSNTFLDVGGALLRYVGVRWNAPEYLISGDASNANYSSTVEAGTPWHKTIEASQGWLKKPAKRACEKILENAAASGRFAEFGVYDWSVLRRLVQVSVIPSEIESREPLQATQRRQALAQSQVISLRTWREEEGYDPDDEETRIATENKPQAAGGLMDLLGQSQGFQGGGGQPPAGPGGPTNGPGGGEGSPPPPAPQPVAHEVAESQARIQALAAECGCKSCPACDAAAKVKAAAKETNREPTLSQAETGNYKKGRVRLHGLVIAIEAPKGSTRRGMGASGKEWSRKMRSHYGHILGTKGADSEPLDVFLGPNPDSELVVVIDQVDKDGEFDEHKIVLGYTRQADAIAGYLANYPEGWKAGPATPMTVPDFKAWAKSRAATKAIASESAVLAAEASDKETYLDNYLDWSMGDMEWSVDEVIAKADQHFKMGKKPKKHFANAGEFAKALASTAAKKFGATPKVKAPISDAAVKAADLSKVPGWGHDGKKAWGAAIFNEAGKVLLRGTTGNYLGYGWSWPKGTPDPGDHPVDTAKREVFEETGHEVDIVGAVPGGFKGTGTSQTHMFLGVSKGQTGEPGWETDGLKWASLDEAKELIETTTTNEVGKARDLAILDASFKAWQAPAADDPLQTATGNVQSQPETIKSDIPYLDPDTEAALAAGPPDPHVDPNDSVDPMLAGDISQIEAQNAALKALHQAGKAKGKGQQVATLGIFENATAAGISQEEASSAWKAGTKEGLLETMTEIGKATGSDGTVEDANLAKYSEVGDQWKIGGHGSFADLNAAFSKGKALADLKALAADQAATKINDAAAKQAYEKAANNAKTYGATDDEINGAWDSGVDEYNAAPDDNPANQKVELYKAAHKLGLQLQAGGEYAPSVHGSPIGYLNMQGDTKTLAELEDKAAALGVDVDKVYGQIQAGSGYNAANAADKAKILEELEDAGANQVNSGYDQATQSKAIDLIKAGKAAGLTEDEMDEALNKGAAAAAATNKSKTVLAPGSNCGVGKDGFEKGNVCGALAKHAKKVQNALGTANLAKLKAQGKFPTGILAPLAESWPLHNTAAVGQAKKLALMEKLFNEGKWDELAAVKTSTNGYGKKAAAAQAMLLAAKDASPSQTAPLSSGKPPSTDGWLKTGGKLGTQPGAQYEDPTTGKKHYVKTPGDLQAKNEVLAAKLLEAAGGSVAKVDLVEHNGKLATASEWINGAKPAYGSATVQKEAAKDFAAHAWLANWDAIGAGSENPKANLTQAPDGTLPAVDLGGALIMKGTGTPKPAGEFGKEANEWDTMRNASINPTAASVYGKMTPQQLAASAAKLKHVSDDKIDSLVDQYAPYENQEANDALAAKLKARRDDILKRADALQATASQSQAATASVKAKIGAAIPAGATNATPIPPTPAALPPKPIVKSESNKSAQKKFDELAAAAATGDPSKVEAIPTKAGAKQYYTKKHHQYKQDLLAAMKGGATINPNAPPAPPVKPTPPPKVTPADLPDKYTSSTPWKQVHYDAVYDLGLKGDLKGLDDYWKANESEMQNSATLVSFHQGVRSGVNEVINPPPPPKPVTGAIKEISDKVPIIQDIKGTPASKKIGYYVVAGDLGGTSPTVKFHASKQATSSSQMLNDHKKIYKSLPNSQSNALYSYTGGGYTPQNKSLRQGEPNAAAKNTMRALKKYPILSTDRWFRRGVDLSAGIRSQLKGTVGKVLQAPGMSSTTTNKHTWNGSNVQYRIRPSEGVRGAARVQGFSANKMNQEDEVILPANTRFWVQKVHETNGNGAKVKSLLGYHSSNVQMVIDVIALPTLDAQFDAVLKK